MRLMVSYPVMKEERRSALLAGVWEALLLLGLVVCITCTSPTWMLLIGNMFFALVVNCGETLAGCLLVMVALKNLMGGKARMGLGLCVITLFIGLLALTCLFSVLSHYAYWIFHMKGVAIIALACFLCRKEGVLQTLKSTWQLLCVMVMWISSLICLCCGIVALVQSIAPQEIPVTAPPHVILPENEGRLVRVQACPDTDDELEIPEWGIRCKALIMRAYSLRRSGDEACDFYREVSAKNFRLGAYRLPGVQDFRFFVTLNGTELPWPPPHALPEEAVTALPSGWEEMDRSEDVNELTIRAKVGEKQVNMHFACYPFNENYMVEVQGRQRGDALEDVKVVIPYGIRGMRMMNHSDESCVPGAVIAFFVAIIAYLLGGARGHSPLMFGKPWVSCVVVAVLLALAITHDIPVSRGVMADSWIYMLLSLVCICVNMVVHRKSMPDREP